jgi:predicted acetyltransferase
MTVDLKRDLTIRVKSFNEIANDKDLLKNLRKLTLDHFSGMNHELNSFEKIAKTREVKAKVILAYVSEELVGWALMSRESSDYYFKRSQSGFKSHQGVLFEIFISYLYRRQGIGSEIIKIARRKAGPYQLCFAPWNKISNDFYDNFKHYKHKKL